MRILGVLLGVLLLAGCAEKAPAPEKFQFTAKTLEGAEFRGEKLVGQPAVLWFWTPWCPSCNAEAEKVAEMAERHGKAVRLGSRVQLGQGAARLRRGPAGAGVHQDVAHRREVDHEAIVADGMAGDVVPATPDRHQQTVPAGEKDRLDDVVGRRAARDQ